VRSFPPHAFALVRLYDLDIVFSSRFSRSNALSITAIELFRGRNNLQITRSAFLPPTLPAVPDST
jgi:hypothetical protein